MIIVTPLLKKALKEIFVAGADIIDIGGGLRFSKKQGNRYDAALEWLLPLTAVCRYRIMDPVPTYNPDIVGDIHSLPFENGSLDSIVCMSVLEHVDDPALACREMLRVLKPGGKLLLYVPFLFYYHAEPGYYKDYWRFTEDGIRVLLKEFRSVEVETTRGALETVLNLFPFGSSLPVRTAARFFDNVAGKRNSHQTAGYHVFAVK